MSENSLSLKIKQLRKLKDKTQSEFAELLGVSQGNIADIENGRREPSKDLIRKIIDKYQVDANWLLTDLNIGSAIKEKPDIYGIVTDSFTDYAAKVGTRVRIVGNMPAGTRIDILDEEPKSEMWLPFTDVKDCVAFTIIGNSMENLYFEGDVVIVRPRSVDQDIHDGHIYGLDYRIDDQLYRTVKYVYREGRDAFRLRSKNGNHKDIVVKDVIRFYRIIKEIRGFTDQLA